MDYDSNAFKPMSARLVWIATCEICETTNNFDGSLSVEELGDAVRAVGWELPVYGGMFCNRCAHTVKVLGQSTPIIASAARYINE